jgi:transketolase
MKPYPPVTQLEVFIKALAVSAHPRHINFILVTCDSLRSFRLESFAHRYPERVIDVGIAEANAVATAFGLWRSGLKVFVAGFANFLVLRALEPIRSYLAYHQADVTLLGGMGGLSAGNDGVMHHSTEEIGILRSIPGLEIIIPSDEAFTRAAARRCIEVPGPRYVRLVRRPVVLQVPTPVDETGWTPLRFLTEPHGEVLLCTSGALVTEALKAVSILRQELGMQVALLEVSQLALFPAEELRKIAGGFSKVAVCEEHQPVGALGSAVAEALSGMKRILLHLNLQGKYPGSGSYSSLLQAAGLDARQIASQLTTWIRDES